MRKTLFLLATLFPVLVLAQTSTENYIKTTTYRKESAASPQTSITYFDGLGRPIQQVAYKQAGNNNDIVTHIEYDALGRQTKEFLPLVSGQTLNYHTLDSAAVRGYYTSLTFPSMDTTSTPFSEKQYEASPLNRILKQAAPGHIWKMGSGHEVRFDYQTNVTEEVRLFGVTLTWNTATGAYEPTLVSNGYYYAENKLYKTITKNENWISGDNNTTQEFKDQEGRVILKRTFGVSMVEEVPVNTTHDTYYVYDAYGNLTFVLPPLFDSSIGIEDQLKGVCYQYQYDHRNRLVAKRIPGKQWEYIVYNNQDKPIATGPAPNPWGDGTWGWVITKYDAFGRVAYTGWKESAAIDAEGRKTFEDTLDTNWAEQYVSSPNTIDTVLVNYTNNTEPQEFILLTVNYYDTYSYTGGPVLPTDIFEVPVSTAVKGLATGSLVRVLEVANTAPMEVSYSFYDAKGRVIESTKNYPSGGYTVTDSKLDFTGKPDYTLTFHKHDTAATAIKIKDMYTYTAQDRLWVHTQQIDEGTVELIAENEYDELGQLIVKQVGGEEVTTYEGLQKVDYRYNIRGWLKSINDVGNLEESTYPKDLFAFKINYDLAEDDVDDQVKALYNGNIAETFWKTSTDNVMRKYGYQYDDLNRLNKAIYQRPSATVPVTHMYDEEINYDKNGNITNLMRNGDNDGTDVMYTYTMDNLIYTYDPTLKNRLMKVTDTTNRSQGLNDDSDGTDDNVNDYDYDENGNMTKDQNKQISKIRYNHFNLPTKISFDGGPKIEYLYNAIGQKERKTVTIGTTVVVTDYLDGFQYRDGRLVFFPHAEGYVNVTYCETCDPPVSKYSYVFNYLDHLGNIRVSYGYDEQEEELKILEENHYYPFGLKHTSYNEQKNKFDFENPLGIHIREVALGENVPYTYKFNGKEYQDELGLNMYDYGARNYDPAIGRWMNIDPLAEVSRRWSPYTYAYNNPISYIDKDGRRAQKSDYNWETGEYASGSFEAALANQGLNDKGEAPPDDVTVGADGKVTNVVKNGNPNRFFDAKGKEFNFNDSSVVDKSMLSQNFKIGDEIFTNISDEALDLSHYIGGTEPLEYNIKFGKTFGSNPYFKYKAFDSAAINSHDEKKADFTFSVLTKLGGQYFRFGNQHTLYNTYDAGNFMWGSWMKFSKFTFTETKIGSQANEFGGDSDADQRAIKNGFNYKL